METDLSAFERFPLDELVEVANLYKRRLLSLFTEERKMGLMLPQLNTTIRDYEHLLVSIQSMRFDLGLDEFKRGQILPHEVERMIQEEAERRVQERDRRTQQQVQEAVEYMQGVFDRLKIPKDIEDHRYAQNSWSTNQTDARGSEERYVQQQ